MNYLKINTMKIIATLIHDGISYGIPEGTKVPEKPRSSCGGKPFCCEGTRCERLAYDEAIQALLSVSIQWEDQEAIAYYTPNEAFPTHAAAKKNPSVIDGIYPLEGVEVETVFQEKVYAGLRDGENDEFNWVEIEQHTAEMHIEHDTAQVRQVLRLIPQPNSEQKTDEEKFMLNDLKEITGGKPIKVEGTEVSEPTIYGKDIHDRFVGVDEKKGPEVNSAHSYTEGSDIPAADENYDHCPRCGSTENGHVTYGIDCNPPSAKSNRTSLAQQIAAVEEIAKYEIKGATKEDGKLFKQALQDAANSLIVIADLRALNDQLYAAGEANTNHYKELLDKI